LNRYQVFAPHGDWSLLDAVSGPRHVFTVFREPMERILSFYFFLRRKAAAMSIEERSLPQHQGLRAVHELTPDQYFLQGDPHIRSFLDDNYDNFYTYYFAGRTLDARRRYSGLLQRGVVTSQRLLGIAQDNIDQLDATYTVDRLGQVRSDIESLSGRKLSRAYALNVNREQPKPQRLDALRALGASDAVFERLNSYCRLDNQVWEGRKAAKRQGERAA